MNMMLEISKSSDIKSAFDKISSQLAKSNNRSRINDNELEKLREHFTCHAFNRTPEEIYSETYLDFFFKYGLSNILKNYYVISEIKALGLLSSNRCILDIGSGPGIFALALRMYCNDNKSFSNHDFKVVLQDCSSEFLQLFDFLWNKMLPTKTHRIESEFLRLFNILWNKMLPTKTHHIEIAQLNELFVGKIPRGNFNPSVIIMSNSLAEMLRDERFSIEDFVESLLEINPIIVIIDYGYEKFQKIFNQFISRIESHYDEISLYTWSTWNKNFKSVDLIPFSEMNMNLSSNVSFIKSIYIPKKDRNKYKHEFYTDIVLLYKKAWENHDLNLLDDLFTEEATYIIDSRDPSRDPLKGIRSIKKYWYNNSIEQESVTFYPQFISLNLNIVHCDWISIFYRKDIGKWMLLNGIIDARLDLETNKISHFEEQFSKQLFDEKPSVFHKDAIQDLELCY